MKNRREDWSDLFETFLRQCWTFDVFHGVYFLRQTLTLVAFDELHRRFAVGMQIREILSEIEFRS